MKEFRRKYKRFKRLKNKICKIDHKLIKNQKESAYKVKKIVKKN